MPIAGEIYLSAPFKVNISEGSWGGMSDKTGNQGTKSYSFGKELANVKATVSGYHDDNGHQTCARVRGCAVRRLDLLESAVLCSDRRRRDLRWWPTDLRAGEGGLRAVFQGGGRNYA